MIQGLLSDPSFIPVTIVVALFILFSYWQKLNKYIIHLSIVYVAFLVFTALSYRGYDQAEVKDANIAIEDSSSEDVDIILSAQTNSSKDDKPDFESSSAFAIKEYIPKEEKVDNLPKTISVKRLKYKF